MKFIHAADIHLDSPLRGLSRYEGAPVEEIRSATRHAFDNLIELAIEEAVDFVLLAGDLYDGDWKDYNTGLYFVDRMRRLQAAGILAFIIAGNHDAASQITKRLRLPDNTTLFNTAKPQTELVDRLNLAVHGQGFSKREVTDDLSQAFPQADPHRFNIGLLHTCLDGKPGHEPYAPCKVSGLQSKGYQYWALGHIHNREVISEAPWIVFPGNIQGRHIRETGAKGCTLVTVKDGSITAVEHRDLDVLRWQVCTVDISSCISGDEVYDCVRDALECIVDEADGRLSACRLVIEGSTAVHAQLHGEREHWINEFRALANGLGRAGLWLEKVLFKTHPIIDYDTEDDMLGGLGQAVAQIKSDPDRLTELGNELTALRNKLPPQLLGGDDVFDPCKTEFLTDSLTDIEELLLHRLRHGNHSQ